MMICSDGRDAIYYYVGGADEFDIAQAQCLEVGRERLVSKENLKNACGGRSEKKTLLSIKCKGP